MENVKSILNPLTHDLQKLILILGLEPDWLSACVAEIRAELDQIKTESYSEVEQKSIFDLRTLLPNFQQPASLLSKTNGSVTAVNNDSFKSLSAEFSVTPAQSNNNTRASIMLTPQKAISPYEEHIAAIEVIANNLPASLIKILAPLHKIISIYKHVWNEWESADIQKKQQLTVPKAQITSESLPGETHGFYYISHDLAHKLICRDGFGFQKRTNIYGNHAVAAHGGIHFKPNPEGHDFVSPGMEYAMYSFYTLLGGRYLAAPTTLIKVSNVRIDHIDLNASDETARNAFRNLTYQGIPVEIILQNNPELRQQLTIRPKEIERIIQAGQTIDGMSFDHLLNLIEKYEWLKQISGENFLPQLTEVITNQYLKKFLTANPQFNHQITEDQLLQAFQWIMVQTNSAFRNFSPTHDVGTFRTLNKGLKTDEIVKCLALISHWPQIIKNQDYTDIVQLPKLLNSLNHLFPNKSTAQIDSLLLNLFNKIDNYKFTALVFASLLTNPSDGKADNYMAVFRRNNHHEIEQWWPISIDGDQALAPAIACGKDGMHYPSVKCTLYALPAMQHQINKTFTEQFLKQTPEYFILKWLGELFQQNQRYERLKALHVVTHKDLFDEDAGGPALDIPIRLEPSVVPLIYAKFKLLQNFIATNQNLTLQTVFEKIEPILAKFYQAVIKRKNNPLSAMHFIYNGDEILPSAKIEQILKDQLNDIVSIPEFTSASFSYHKTTIQEALKSYTANEYSYLENRIQSIEEIVLNFINNINFNENLQSIEQLFPVLALIGEYFPFIKALPNFSKEQFNRILLLSATCDSLTFKPWHIVRFALSAGADINCVDPNQLKRNALHLAIINQQPCLEVIKELLSCSKREKNALDAEGNLALWLAFSLHSGNSALIELLLTDENIEFVHNNKTLLDIAIEKNLPDIFLALVHKGAGRKANAEKLLAFVNSYKTHEYYGLAFQEACTRLKQANTQFGWFVLRNALMQSDIKSNTGFVLQVEGLRSGKHQLTPEVTSQLFQAATGEIKRNNKYGRRPVAYIKVGSEEAHFKVFPELPLAEEAVRSLDRILFDKSCVAESEIFCFKDKANRSFPVLISQHVPGENLQETVLNINKIKEMDKTFDQHHFTQLLFLTLLINPEDGKPDNIINGISIDNDHAFVEPVIKENGKRVVQVKTIIYCLNQMLKPLDKAACEAFLQLKPAETLELWLQHLIVMEKKIDALFSEADYNRLAKENDCILRLFFQPRAIASIYQKFIKIQEILAADPSITGIKLLRDVIPLLGIVYEEMFKKHDNPGSRFHALFQHRYSTIVADRFNTLTTPKQMLASAKIPESDILAKSVKYSAQEALSELKAMIYENKSLDQIRIKLFKGDIEPFNSLFSDSSREKVLEGINIFELNSKLQTSIFKSLEGKALTTLNIANCTSIEYKSLKNLLTHSPALLFLDLSGCTQIDSKILIHLAKNCETIEKLRLDNLPWTSIQNKDKKPLVFANLRRLWLNNNVQLTSIKLNTLYLASLELKNAPKLEVIEIQANGLEILVMNTISPKAEPYVTKLLIQSPKLIKDVINRIKLDQPLNATDIARYCSAYVDNQPWSESVARYILQKGNLLNLNGNNISELGFITLLSYSSMLQSIDLRGCTRIGWQNIAELLKINVLEKIQLTDYTKPKEQAAKVLETSAPIHVLTTNTNGELISASQDKTIKIYETQYQQEKTTLQGHKDHVTALFCLANNTIISGDYSGTVKVWNPITKECQITLNGHAKSITGLRYSYKHQLLITTSLDKTIKYWDIYTGDCIKTMSAGLEINCLETINDDTFVIGTTNSIIQTWDIASCSWMRKIEKEHKGFIYALKRINSRYLASAGGDKIIKIWDFEKMTCVNTLVGHTGSVLCLELLLGGKIIASGSSDKTIRVWDVMTGQCYVTLANKEHNNFIKSIVAYSYNRLISAGEDGKICFWQFPSKNIEPKVLHKHAFIGQIDIRQNDKTIILTFETAKKNQTITMPLLNDVVEIVSKCLGSLGFETKIPNTFQIIFTAENSFVYQALLIIVNAIKIHLESLSSSNLQSLDQKPEISSNKQIESLYTVGFQPTSVSSQLKTDENKRHSFIVAKPSEASSQRASISLQQNTDGGKRHSFFVARPSSLSNPKIMLGSANTTATNAAELNNRNLNVK